MTLIIPKITLYLAAKIRQLKSYVFSVLRNIINIILIIFEYLRDHLGEWARTKNSAYAILFIITVLGLPSSTGYIIEIALKFLTTPVSTPTLPPPPYTPPIPPPGAPSMPHQAEIDAANARREAAKAETETATARKEAAEAEARLIKERALQVEGDTQRYDAIRKAESEALTAHQRLAEAEERIANARIAASEAEERAAIQRAEDTPPPAALQVAPLQQEASLPYPRIRIGAVNGAKSDEFIRAIQEKRDRILNSSPNNRGIIVIISADIQERRSQVLVGTPPLYDVQVTVDWENAPGMISRSVRFPNQPSVWSAAIAFAAYFENQGWRSH